MISEQFDTDSQHFFQFNEVNMQSLNKIYFAGMVLILAASLSMPVQAKVVGNKIILGSAISFTGKYSSNGIHASNGYNLGVKRVNEMGGVKVGGKTYMLEVKYYDDESTPARGAQLAERLIKQDGIKSVSYTHLTLPTILLV